jgi:hypothetical protein
MFGLPPLRHTPTLPTAEIPYSSECVRFTSASRRQLARLNRDPRAGHGMRLKRSRFIVRVDSEFAPDSPLERTGFEPPVPLLQRAVLLAGHPGRRHENRSQLRSGPRPRWLPGENSQPFRSRWDHEFESVFLQRRVGCELGPTSPTSLYRRGDTPRPDRRKSPADQTTADKKRETLSNPPGDRPGVCSV